MSDVAIDRGIAEGGPIPVGYRMDPQEQAFYALAAIRRVLDLYAKQGTRVRKIVVSRPVLDGLTKTQLYKPLVGNAVVPGPLGFLGPERIEVYQMRPNEANRRRFLVEVSATTMLLPRAPKEGVVTWMDV